MTFLYWNSTFLSLSYDFSVSHSRKLKTSPLTPADDMLGLIIVLVSEMWAKVTRVPVPGPKPQEASYVSAYSLGLQ